MAITFFCSACGVQMRGYDRLVESSVKCPACGPATTVPLKPLPTEDELAGPPPVARQQFVEQTIVTPHPFAAKQTPT